MSDSETTLLKTRMKQILMDLRKEIFNMESHEDVVAYYEAKARESMKPYLSLFTFSAENKAYIDGLNAQVGKNTKDPWRYNHIMGENMLKGFHYVHKPATPILNHQDMARIFGMSRFVVECERQSKLPSSKT